MAELMLNHSTYNECKDIESFKQELGELVCSFREDAISLKRVSCAVTKPFHTFSFCFRPTFTLNKPFSPFKVVLLR